METEVFLQGQQQNSLNLLCFCQAVAVQAIFWFPWVVSPLTSRFVVVDSSVQADQEASLKNGAGFV